jgi:hypothetical protein
MSFFSKSLPNLIENNTINEIKNMMGGSPVDLSATNDVQINNNWSGFYANYIQPNMFFIVLAILFLLFLYWKYETKNGQNNNNQENQENYQNMRQKKKQYKKELNSIIIDDLIEKIDNKNNNNNNEFVANFNPSLPVSVQNSYTDYMENHIPINIGNANNNKNKNNKITYNEYINSKKQTQNQNQEPNYEYMPIIKNKLNTASTYTGLYNEYNNFADQGYDNPYGWEQNFNESTYNAIDYATQKNQNSVAMMNQYVDNTNNDLLRNLDNNYYNN